MAIEYDPAKRERTLAERGLDFDDAATVFDGLHYTQTDDRHDYGEERLITVGTMHERIVVIVWTQRLDNIRVISMRAAHDNERRAYQRWLERSG